MPKPPYRRRENIMIVIPLFPDHRLREPKRMAELAVYRELEASDAPGTAIYEAKASRHLPRGRLRDHGPTESGATPRRSKGGIHRVQGGIWYRSTPRGEVRVPTPLAQLWGSDHGPSRSTCRNGSRTVSEVHSSCPGPATAGHGSRPSHRSLGRTHPCPCGCSAPTT